MTTRNVAIQLGTPLDFETVGTGLVQSGLSPFAMSTTLSSSATGGSARSALTRPLAGSFFLRVEITAAASSLNIGAIFGLVPERRRMSYQERRPPNVARPQDYSPIAAHLGGCVIGLSGVSYESGALVVNGFPNLVVGSVVWVRYDADSRRVRFIHGPDPDTGVAWTSSNTYDGPMRFIANVYSSGFQIMVTHGGPVLPPMGKFRPAGVWGRVASWGFMDGSGAWDGSIPVGSDPEFEMAAAFRVMGNLGRRSSVGDITVVNRCVSPQSEVRQYADWLLWGLRDEPFTIFRSSTSFDESPALMTAVARGVVDSISEPSDGRIAISCRDPGSSLDVPWQSSVYPASTPLATLRGKKLPTAMGVMWAAPLVQKDASLLLYDLADDALYQAPAPVYDKGVQLTAGVGYSAPPDAMSIKRLTNPEGLMCAGIAAGMIEDSRIGTDIGDLVGWTGTPAAPRGWINSSTGTGTVTSAVTSGLGGARIYRPDASGVPFLRVNAALFNASGTYRMDLDIASGVSGTLGIYRVNAAGTGYSLLWSIPVTGASGVHTLFTTLSLTLSTGFGFRFVSTTGDVTIRSVRLSKVTYATNTSHFMRLAACQRGSIPVDKLDTSLTNYPDPSGLCLGTAPDDSSTVAQRMDEIMASTLGTYWFDLSGNLCCGRLLDPWSVVQEDNIPVITTLSIIGGVTSVLDQAGGLSSRVGWDPVWQRHDESDIAGSLNTTPAGRTLASSLKSEYVSISEASTKLAGCYKFADQEAPYHTLQSALGDGEAVADRLASIYSKERRIYTVTCNLGDALSVRPCSVLDLVYAGKPPQRLLVLSVRGRYSADVATLTLWG